MFEMISKLFISLLQDNNIDFFLGGSRRFGYDTPKSDFDFFLRVHSGEALQNFLFRQGFSRVSNPDYKFSEHWRIAIGDSHLDAIILDPREFITLQKEHALVENSIRSFPKNALHFIKVLTRITGISGADIYRALRSTI
jgi:hypothetical protein